jgi:hypothetical protein
VTHEWSRVGVLREADDQRAVDLEGDVVHALAERGDDSDGLVGEVCAQDPADVVSSPVHTGTVPTS